MGFSAQQVKLQLRVFFFFHFFIFLISYTGRTGRPILTFDGSNGAVWRKDPASGVAMTANFIYRAKIFLAI